MLKAVEPNDQKEDGIKNAKGEQNRKKENLKETRAKPEKAQKKVAWIGTSISRVLDKEKFEKDNDVNLEMFKASSIDDDNEAEFPKEKLKFPEDNLKNVVPKVLNNDDFDAVILESGNIEITNININEAVMDIKQDIPNLKKKWFNSVENDSMKLFEIAEEAVEKNPDLEVIIVKRLPRHDKSSQDNLDIKWREKINNKNDKCYNKC